MSSAAEHGHKADAAQKPGGLMRAPSTTEKVKERMKDEFFGKVLLLETVGAAGNASIVELFYDLIFVAGMYRVRTIVTRCTLTLKSLF